jgi:hypothetical protein
VGTVIDDVTGLKIAIFHMVELGSKAIIEVLA